MSVTAIGPALDLDGPLPVPRRHSLLTTPGVRQPVGDRRWENGVVVQGYPAGTPLAWDPCATGTDRVKSEIADGLAGDALPGGRFDSLGIYFPILCSTHGMRDPSQLGEKVEAALDATLSAGVESALAKGAAGSLNPFFGDTNMDALSLTAVSPQVGLGMLENAGAQTNGREFSIHATPAVVSTWGFDKLEDANGVLRTANGTPVISGAGYIGAHPVGPGGLPGPGTTSDWVFGTSPLGVYVDEEPRFEVVDVIDRTDNTIVYRAERYVLAEWDRSLQVGVLIDWSL